MPLRNTRIQDHGDSYTAAEKVPERSALDHLFSVTYEELRRLASSVKRNDPGATLNPTALVNEAWVKLANSPHFASTSRLHFKRIAARAMRQVLIEAARRRNADKRGGDEGVVFVAFDENQQVASCGKRPARAGCRAGTVGADAPAAGHDGRKPFLWRARRPGDRDPTECFGSHDPA